MVSLGGLADGLPALSQDISVAIPHILTICCRSSHSDNLLPYLSFWQSVTIPLDLTICRHTSHSDYLLPYLSFWQFVGCRHNFHFDNLFPLPLILPICCNTYHSDNLLPYLSFWQSVAIPFFLTNCQLLPYLSFWQSVSNGGRLTVSRMCRHGSEAPINVSGILTNRSFNSWEIPEIRYPYKCICLLTWSFIIKITKSRRKLRHSRSFLLVLTSLFAEIVSGQSEQHLAWPPVYTLFFVCLVLVVVHGSAKSWLCAHVYIVLKGRRLKLQVKYYLVWPFL